MRRASRLPPGPRWYRPIDFLQAGLNPPVHVLARLAAKYGDPFRVNYISGPVTFTGHPEGIRAVYSADPSAFAVWGCDVIEPVFGKASVVVTSGETHRRDRKLLWPAFTGAGMRAYGPAVARITRAAASRFQVRRPFSMLATTQAVTLDVMIEVVFGVEQEAQIERTRRAVLELIESLHVLLFLFPFLRHDLGGIGPWRRHHRAVLALDEILREEIRARRKDERYGENILSRMLLARYDDGTTMSEADLLDHLRGLLFAGHEATATVLAWAFHWLHRRPEVLARVLGEVDELGPSAGPDELAGLPYLEAVCNEVLRLNPPVVDPARIARAPFDLMGYTVPAGEALRACIPMLHARPELFPEPERFRPERFLERRYTPFEFIPFGGGARRCLGAQFAMYEMKVILATLLGVHRFHLADDAPVVHARRGLTFGPRGGVWMVLEGPRVARAPLVAMAAS